MLLTFPLMAAIQEISARVGRVTGHGISGNVCRHYPLVAAQCGGAAAVHRQHHQHRRRSRRHGGRDKTPDRRARHRLCRVLRRDLGRGADLPRLQALRRGAEMADVVAVRLCRRARLCACVLGRGAGGHACMPQLQWNADYLTTIVAILGTTISPYLFFWQASQEAEEQRIDATQAAADRKALRRAAGIPPHPRRHHRRHGVLQPDRAVDHHHGGGDAACVRQDRYPDFGAGRRSAAARSQARSPS